MGGGLPTIDAESVYTAYGYGRPEDGKEKYFETLEDAAASAVLSVRRAAEDGGLHGEAVVTVWRAEGTVCDLLDNAPPVRHHALLEISWPKGAKKPRLEWLDFIPSF